MVRPTLLPDRRLLWTYLVGAAAGSLSGFLIGGVIGRAVMLALRLLNDDARGLTSDDGFVIGRVSLATLNLLLGSAALGAVTGTLYVVLRSFVAARLRMVLWPAVVTAFVGAQVIRDDGIDFTVLDPVAGSVAAFLLLPALSAALTAALVERWARIESPTGAQLRRLGVAAAPATLGLIVAAGAAGAHLALRRAPERLQIVGGRVARYAVPLGLVAVAARSTLTLVETLRAIL